MRVILDTSVLITDSAQPPDLSGLECGLSSVSYGELYFGVSIARSETDRLLRTANLHRIAAIYGSGIPFDDSVATSYGYLFAISHPAGKISRTRVADLMVAATAHSLGIPLVTRNAADFEAITEVLDVLIR